MSKVQTRDQQRAIAAYKNVQEVEPKNRDDYRSAVRNLGPTVLRNGLVVTLAMLQRDKTKEHIKKLASHLASASIPGLNIAVDARGPSERGKADAVDELSERARRLDLEATMLATREFIKVAEWLKRAADATFGPES